MVYFLFLRTVDRFNTSAALLSPNNPQQLQSYYQGAIGLSDSQDLALKQAAASCVATVAQQDALAMKVIAAIRAQYPGGKLASGRQLPPVPPELAQMQANRNALMDSCIAGLVNTLGPAGYEAVDRYVTNVFGAQVIATPIVPPDPRNAGVTNRNGGRVK